MTAARRQRSKGDNRRLIDIQRALVSLIDELDPKRKYTAGYDLEAIDLADANPAQAGPAPVRAKKGS